MEIVYAVLIVLALLLFVFGKIFGAVIEFVDIYSYELSVIVIAILFLGITYIIYKELYFRSEKFKNAKNEIAKYIENCNNLNDYIDELKRTDLTLSSYDYGFSTRSDKSEFNFRRSGWEDFSYSNHIHNCSLSVCRNANDQPAKYLCKYFDIPIDEGSLNRFEKLLNNFTSVEQGKNALISEKKDLIQRISSSIPFLIKRFNFEELERRLGFHQLDISMDYIPVYRFLYVSAGGNSTMESKIYLDLEFLDSLICFLDDKIKWRKSIAGQRALMTSRLREIIKERDGYQCCNCSLGIRDEPNLLLEIDHIIPLSKGGLTKLDNLQTLCWKCNRSKGSKLI